MEYPSSCAYDRRPGVVLKMAALIVLFVVTMVAARYRIRLSYARCVGISPPASPYTPLS